METSAKNQYLRNGMIFVSIVVLTLTLAGCSRRSKRGGSGNDSGGTSSNLKSVNILPKVSFIFVGKQKQFSAICTFSDGKPDALCLSAQWLSSDNAIATVSGSGLVTGKAIGSVTITAQSGAITASSTLDVRLVTLSSIDLTPHDPLISVQKSKQFQATGTFSDGSMEDFTSTATWTSSLPGVATISTTGTTTGLAFGLAAGTTTITVVKDSVSTSTSLRVSDPILSSITVTPGKPVIIVGTTKNFIAEGRFNNGSKEDLTSSVTWSSSDTSLAGIDSAGLATGVAAGDVTITATLQGKKGSTFLGIIAASLTSISVAPPDPLVFAGLTQQFTANGTYDNGQNQDITADVTWASSDTVSATISNEAGSQGKVTAISIGIPTITATLGSIFGTTTLTVTPGDLTSLTIAPASSSIANETKRQFTAKGIFGTGTAIDLTSLVTWVSTSTSVATIDSSGVATGITQGVTNITATFKTTATSTPLTVTNATLTQISVTPVSVSAPVGVTQQFTASGIFSDNSTQDLGLSVTWSSGSQATIGLTDGLARGLSPGTATITATAAFGADPKVFGSSTLIVTSQTLNSLTVTPVDPVMPVGTSQQFQAIGVFSSGSSEDLTSSVTWSSTGFAAGINSAGLATAFEVGFSTITATADNIPLSGSFQPFPSELEVINPTLISVSILPTSGVSIPVGITRQYSAFGIYDNGAVQNITSFAAWSSSQPAIATIDNVGLATALNAGSTSITAKTANITGTTSLDVNTATLESLSVTPESASIGIGSTLQYTATATYNDGASFDVTPFSTWSSSDGSQATIDPSTGLATATGVGTSTIFADFGGASGSASLNVKDISLKSIVVEPADPSISLGGKQQFTAKGIFSDGSSQDITTVVSWQSSSLNTATISNISGSKGLATSVNKDDAPTIITALSGFIFGETNLTVTDPIATGLFLGKDHTCARLTNGAMRCWGGNFSGQLGDGTTKNASIPVVVSGKGVSTLMAAGGSHTCAAFINGKLNCWGKNVNGQLGNKSNTDSKTPVRVSDVLGAIALTAGGSHTCAVFQNGAVRCWGANSSGQLGNGLNADSNQPVFVSGGLVFPDQITAGGAHTCALLSGGGVQCWGDNSSGQLGTAGASSNVPVSIPALTATSISAGGAHTCAVLSGVSAGGNVRCWGKNDKGQLGDGSTTDSTTPVIVADITTATAIFAGGAHTCALLSDETVRCWGENSVGQLGNNSTNNSSIPVTVLTGTSTALSGVSSVSTGGSHTCALLFSGSSQCWGADNFGQLGDDVRPISKEPIPVPEITAGITGVGTGVSYTCAILGGTIKCLGDNEFGQLGNGTTNSSNIPVDVSGIATASAVAVGRFHACALLPLNSIPSNIQCWGANSHGQLGNEETDSTSTPVNVTGITTATSVSAGNNFTCAMLFDKSVRCWGAGLSGQLGNGGNQDLLTPSDGVVMNLQADFISAGSFHTCALSGGTILCWGNNDFGQLGSGTGSTNQPVQVSGITTATALSSGGSHTCALLADKTVICWGQGNAGQLGDGNTTQSQTPVLVNGLSALSITAGSTHTCARLTDNTVQCWGDNGSGQLGNGTTENSTVPQFVTEAGINLSSVIAVSAGGPDTGESHTCALIDNGTMKCWGDGAVGQIGSALILFETMPVKVEGL
ncbi:MAG: Ig-like domain-containing protein [Nitrospirae bacterium]|nr:Ig-like domain-containing protein [Candidatus Troglogloeales bacterium]